MEDERFKVIIVGGSIAGLTLAHCLHRANIDHVVLEKRAEIAPQEGATIGLWPNGNRILDQLGLYDEVGRDGETAKEWLMWIHLVYPDGFVFSHDTPRILYERFGYGLIFLERQKLLEILYQRYPDKSKILLGNAVVEIQQSASGVSVNTADGTNYHGSIVVGADGVHSRVRSEMWRLAESLSPGLVTAKERKTLTAEYACVFGISSSIPGLQGGENINVCTRGFASVTFHGDGRVYWFMITRLDRRYIYPHIPRYTVKDAEDLCARFAHVRISGNVTVRDIWESRQVGSMTAMEEGVFKTWTHDRIVLLGDAVHKSTVVTGQGANNAIEDAAVLATLLEKLLTKGNKGNNEQHLDSQEITAILKEFQVLRYARSKTLYERSRLAVRVQTCDSLAKRVIGRYIMPRIKKQIAEAASALMAGGPVIGFLPLSARSLREWKMNASSTGGSGWARWMVSCLLLAVGCLFLLIFRAKNQLSIATQ
ncbi:FAD/NAD(P)-binding domain-containing protein [Aspergillus crustosus]